LTFLQQTAAASAAAAASQAAAQLPNRTLTPRYGSKQSAVYATWALDPTYTLLLDPRELPAVQGQLGEAPLPQMFADTHLQNTDEDVVPLPAAAGSASGVSLGAGSMGGGAPVARALLQQDTTTISNSSSRETPETWEVEAAGALPAAAAAAGAWAPPVGEAASSWRLAEGGRHSQQQQQQGGQPNPGPTTIPASSKGHRRLLQTNTSLSRGVQNGVLYIPPGTYVLKKRIDMRRPNLVIRGAGMDRTTIYIPVSLSEVYGNSLLNGTSSVSDWSHSTGFINFFG
jgi:hypothetical protein